MGVVKLRIVQEGAPPRTVALDGHSFTVGRTAGCDLCIEQAAISRVHAKLFYDERRGWMIADLESSNGLFLNGVRVIRTQALKARDRLRLGAVDVVVLELPDTDEAPAAASADRPPAPIEREVTEIGPAPDDSETIGGADRLENAAAEKALPEKLNTLYRAETLTHDYLKAMAQAREGFERFWQVVKSRTPPTRAAEMVALHQGVEAGLVRLEKMAKGIDASTDRLCKLVEAARVISAPQGLRERLETILDLAIAQMGADCGFLMLYSRRLRGLKLSIQRNMGNLQENVPLSGEETGANRPSVSIAQRALKSGTTVFERLDSADTRGPAMDGVGQMMAGQGIHAAICAPMKIEGRFLGLIYVDFRDPSRLKGERSIGPDDADWLEGLASLAALAIENARLIQKSRRGKKVQKEEG